ncbi:MAG: hypothetical protein AABY28_03085 [Candidatus Omnitrophota bacterium]
MKSIRPRSKIKAVFCIPVFIFGLFKGDLFAGRAEFEKIQSLENQEKQPASERIIRPNIEYKAAGLRDPFEGPSVKKSEDKERAAEPKVSSVTPPDLIVQGLIWGGNIPQAIINDKVIKAGDTIQGAKIISITKDGVSVLFEGMQYSLSSPAMSAGIKKPEGGRE